MQPENNSAVLIDVCAMCEEKVDKNFVHICKFNFKWFVSDNFNFEFYTKKTWYNRMKWFIATKLFLPGTYKWLK